MTQPSLERQQSEKGGGREEGGRGREGGVLLQTVHTFRDVLTRKPQTNQEIKNSEKGNLGMNQVCMRCIVEVYH